MNLAQRIKNLSSPLQPIDAGAVESLASLDDLQAVLFDVYGTLIISSSGDIGVATAQDSAAAFAEAIKAVRLPADCITPRRAVDRLREVIGQHHARRRAGGIDYPEVDIREVWSEVLAAGCDLHPPRDVLEALTIEYECRVNPTWPMPDLLPTLEALRAAGLKLGIVSNAQFFTPLLFDAFLGQSLSQLGFDPDLRIYSFELLEAKPSTALYQLAAARLRERENIQPHQTLYLGNDMLNDIAPAQQVGFRTALFAGDRRSLRLRPGDQRVAGIRPDMTLTALASLRPPNRSSSSTATR